jgi:serine-type D-Ala-D-Ala carboxypeptidase (penicillin-binding protein 5/6)
VVGFDGLARPGPAVKDRHVIASVLLKLLALVASTLVAAQVSTATPVAGEPVTEAARGNGTVYRPLGHVPAPPKVRARSWVVVDLASGNILGRHRARAKLPQASTIKLLTAVTSLHLIHPTDPLRATRRPTKMICSCAGVKAGREYSRAMLLSGLLVPSGNDAAEALAGADPRGRAHFIGEMNRTAARLGATDTVARNPSGLDQPGARSSARDLVIFLREATRRPRIARWLDTTSTRFGPIGARRHVLGSSTDYLYMFPDAYAAKNGFTSRAGNTLTAATLINGRRIGVALLDARSGFTTEGARGLTTWAANNADRLAPVGRLPGSPTTTPVTTPAG